MLPALAIPAALGAVQTISGIIGGNKAKKQAEELARTRPVYQISPYAQQQVSLAENELSNGLGAAATTAYNEGIDRDLSTSIDAILRSGGSVNNIGDVFDRSVMGRSKLAQLEEQNRMNQIGNITRAYSNMQEQQDKAFEFNKWNVWADKAQANAQARQNANNNIWGGLNTLGSAATNYLSGMNQQQQQQNYLWQGRTDYNSSIPYGTSATIAPIQNQFDFNNNTQIPTSAVLGGRPISY